MSIRMMTAVWDSGLYDKTTLLIVLSLADQANDNGTCWPSVRYIAKRARCSTRHVRSVIADLETAGALTIEHRTGRSSMYRLHKSHFPEPPEDPHEDHEGGEPQFRGENSSGVNPSSGGGGTGVQGGAEPQFRGGLNPSSPRITNEPSVNRQDEPPTHSVGEADASTPGGSDEFDNDKTGDHEHHTAPTSTPDTLFVAADPVVEGTIIDSDPQPTAQSLVGEWIAHRQAVAGTRPTGRVIGHLSRELKLLLDEGQPYEQVAAGLKLWDSKNLHPSCLASCVDEARAPAPKPRRQQETDAIFAGAMARAAAGAPNPFMSAEENAAAGASFPAADNPFLALGRAV